MSDGHILSNAVTFILYHYTRIAPLLPTYIHLLAAALFPIYTGSHASLCQPPNCAPKSLKHERNKDGQHSEEEEEEEDINEETSPLREKLSKWDALIFPFTAGCTLGILYLIITYASAAILNRVMATYMTFMGVFALGGFFGDALGIWTDFTFPQSWGNTKDHAWKVKHDRVLQISPSVIEAKDAVPLPYGHVLGRVLSIRVANLLYWIKQCLNSHFTIKATSSLYKKEPLYIRISLKTIVGYSFAGLSVITYYFWPGQKPWFLTNILGTSFSYSAIQLLSPSSFPTASLLLIALFFYDIFFVFYTPLMVTVATSLDLPIKLLFPRPIDGSAAPNAPKSMAMLGLGDIVLPGMVIALALRFDLWRFYEKKRLCMVELARAQNKLLEKCLDDSEKKIPVYDLIKPSYKKSTGNWGTRFWTKSMPYELAGQFPKPYFHASCIGYVVGMCLTIGVMHMFRHAQPALLYLVPSVLSGLWLTALFKGEIGWFWNWTELMDEVEKKDVKNLAHETSKLLESNDKKMDNAGQMKEEKF